MAKQIEPLGDMPSDLFRRRRPLAQGWEYQLPAGELATPAQSAEYRRRRRRVACYQLLVVFGIVPAAMWIGARYFPHGTFQLVYMIAASVILGSLFIFAAASFRCPACEMPIENDTEQSRIDLSPERRAALYGRYRWCDGCGTRFEIYPHATFPPESDEGAPEGRRQDRRSIARRALKQRFRLLLPRRAV